MNYYDEEVEIFGHGKVDSPVQLGSPEQQQSESTSKFNSKMSAALEKPKPIIRPRDSFDSDSDLTQSDEQKEQNEAQMIEKWKNLDVPADIKECFQYIPKYTPQNTTIDYNLQPFIPEFVPAVGDVDAFLKVNHPLEVLSKKTDNHEIYKLISKLGLKILDEPSGQQTEPSLLQIKLRSVMPSTSAKIPTAIVKTPKDIDKWISEIRQYHNINEPKNVALQKNTPDIDALMEEWPLRFEQALGNYGFPPPNLDCSLEFYVQMVCGIFDIPLGEKTRTDYISALNTLFNLYLAIENPNET